MYLLAGWFSAFSLGVFVLHFVWNSRRKGLFSCNLLKYFSLVVSPKGLSLKSFVSSYSVLFACFPFVPPSKFHLFSLVFVHQPLLENISLGVSSVFLCFAAFPLFMFACLFQTNFPNIPFCETQVAFIFGCFFHLFYCFCFCFHVSCFCLSVLMLALFGVCFSFDFILV